MLSCFGRVRQELLNLSNIKAGDTSAGDSSPTGPGRGGVGVQRVEVTPEWPSIGFLWAHSAYNNTSAPLSSVNKLWGEQLCFLLGTAASTKHDSKTEARNKQQTIKVAPRKRKCWLVRALHMFRNMRTLSRWVTAGFFLITWLTACTYCRRRGQMFTLAHMQLGFAFTKMWN